MVIFKVFYSKVSISKLEKSDNLFRKWVENIADQLAEYPFHGKTLGRKWFREKKFLKYRLYFLVFEKYESVLIVNFSEKKDQQKIIQAIMSNINLFQKEIETFLDVSEF